MAHLVSTGLGWQPEVRLLGDLGKKPNETWFFVRGVGPSEWLRVVVAYEAGRGWIVTAFPRRKFP